MNYSTWYQRNQDFLLFLVFFVTKSVKDILIFSATTTRYTYIKNVWQIEGKTLDIKISKFVFGFTLLL